MKRLIFIILLSISQVIFSMENKFNESKEKISEKIRQSNRISDLENYIFTPKNIKDFKFFLQCSVDILEGRSIYSVLKNLDYPFEGGEHIPKKLFTPITSGYFIYSYLFEEPTK